MWLISWFTWWMICWKYWVTDWLVDRLVDRLIICMTNRSPDSLVISSQACLIIWFIDQLTNLMTDLLTCRLTKISAVYCLIHMRMHVCQIPCKLERFPWSKQKQTFRGFTPSLIDSIATLGHWTTFPLSTMRKKKRKEKSLQYICWYIAALGTHTHITVLSLRVTEQLPDLHWPWSERSRSSAVFWCHAVSLPRLHEICRITFYFHAWWHDANI